MAQIVIGLIATGLMIWISIIANGKFRDQNRLPMQWLLNGEVTWTAPRGIALAFIPVLGIPTVWAVVALTILVAPRPGQEGLEVPIILLVGLGLVATQWLHIWLINRHLQRKGR